MGEFLHCFDLSDKLKCLNFCSRNVIESLFSLQLINNDTKPNPRAIAIENLIDCQPEHINGISSPRMWLIYKASLYRKLDRTLTSEEQIIVKKAELEITFEKIRRLINFGAPSRLSCIYLVDNSIDGRIVLQNMFVDYFINPFIVEVDILNQMELTKCDQRWLEKYYDEPNNEFVKNYWDGVAFNEKCASWEYLLEGTIILTNLEEAKLIDEHVMKNFLIEYEQIKSGRSLQQ